jgi:hypothetical protein
MTNPPDPFGPRLSGSDPFGGAPFGQAPGGPPIVTAGPPTRPPANTLATLSVIFAFLFAPAGAVLGHLGLSQIRRTGQPGRERALIGLAASYAVIAITVAAVVVWAALGANNTDSRSTLAAPSHTASAPSPTPVTTTTAPPPPPTVAPADLTGLLPTLVDVKNFVSDDGLTMYKESRQLEGDTEGAKLDRPECIAVMESGAPEVYNMPAVTGVYGIEVRDFVDRTDPIQSGNTVVSFRDIRTAHAQLDSILSAWRLCANSTVRVTFPSGQMVSNDLGAPADAGNGITILPVSINPNRLTVLRLIAAKANIVIDVLLTSKTSRGEQQNALAMVNFILDKIPGPR